MMISITRALSELKNLDRKISNKIAELITFQVTIGGKLSSIRYGNDIKEA